MKQSIENIRHSLAHIMAFAVGKLYPGVKFGIGPMIEDGFYYDFDVKHNFSSDDLPKIEEKMKEIIAKNIKFEKKEVSINEAKKNFKDQPFKLELLDALAQESSKVSIYQSGDFIDLCKGPHVVSSKDLNPDAFKLLKVAGAYWKGEEKNPQLQRIYGVAFQTKKELAEYLKLQREAEKRDHRKIGRVLDLFSFQDIAPGAAFWHPKGMIIIREFEKYWRKIHDENGYQETSTPIMVKSEVFQKSGHWDYYRENMFYFDWENETYVLKPMNCPESTYIFGAQIRSYRDLPIRLSEIGRLHRNELTGTLGGLFRVRQLTMDDAHIYAREDQIQEEISSLLKLVKNFYSLFSFEPFFYLATKPDDAMGDEKLWKRAEDALQAALKENKVKFETKPKDGAFYGPKIDIHIRDALKRDWQLATIQVDFNLAKNFNLNYIDKNGNKVRPIVIHRAIFGSFERFLGVLLEHYAGALPAWLSPIQVAILPVNDNKENIKYCLSVIRDLKKQDIRVWLNDRNETISKKVREAELQKIPYLLIIGDKEVESKKVSIRERQKGNIGEMPLEKFLEKITKEIEGKT